MPSRVLRQQRSRRQGSSGPGVQRPALAKLPGPQGLAARPALGLKQDLLRPGVDATGAHAALHRPKLDLELEVLVARDAGELANEPEHVAVGGRGPPIDPDLAEQEAGRDGLARLGLARGWRCPVALSDRTPNRLGESRRPSP